MRSSEATPQATVPATVQPTAARSVSGVCSECGTTYSVAANGGNESWQCPCCGPSTPIVVKDAPRKSKRRQRRRLPRIRLPFFVVQVFVVLLTFAIFMVSVKFYLEGRPRFRKKLPRPAMAEAGVLATNSPPAGAEEQPSDNQDGEVAPGNTADSAEEPTPNHALTPVAPADEIPPREIANSANSTSPRPLSAENGSLVSQSDNTSSLPLRELPQVIPEGTMTARQVQNRSSQLFETELRMLCQVLAVHDDAVGKVPNSYYVGDRKIELSESDEADFLRLEVMDPRGDTLDSVFVGRKGTVGSEFQWILPGDWVLVTATVGMRYDNVTSGLTWGVILTKIAALQEHSHESHEAESKRLAER